MIPKNWLITGVSSGFGRIMAEQLLAHGDRVRGRHGPQPFDHGQPEGRA